MAVILMLSVVAQVFAQHVDDKKKDIIKIKKSPLYLYQEATHSKASRKQ